MPRHTPAILPGPPAFAFYHPNDCATPSWEAENRSLSHFGKTAALDASESGRALSRTWHLPRKLTTVEVVRPGATKRRVWAPTGRGWASRTPALSKGQNTSRSRAARSSPSQSSADCTTTINWWRSGTRIADGDGRMRGVARTGGYSQRRLPELTTSCSTGRGDLLRGSSRHPRASSTVRGRR